MPNRIIKESINESQYLTECSVFAQDLYKRLITYADDYGRFNADTTIMLARLYPRELDSVTQDDIVDGIIELNGAGKVAFYTSSARRDVYGCFPNWDEHQRVRQSRKKYPDPDDTTVNDWYHQRFISRDMKTAIIERDGFKCRECGKLITTEKDARRLVKHGGGLYHIDHIVPVLQGGRATMENLRLTCPACNQARKKRFSFTEILDFTAVCRNSPQLAATRRNLPQVAATCGNSPPESNPNPNPNPNPKSRGAAAPARTQRGEYGWVKLSDEEYARLQADLGEAELARCIRYVDEAAQGTANKNKWKDWALTIRRCARDKWGVAGAGVQKRKVSFADYDQGDPVPNYIDRQTAALLAEARELDAAGGG